MGVGVGDVEIHHAVPEYLLFWYAHDSVGKLGRGEMIHRRGLAAPKLLMRYP